MELRFILAPYLPHNLKVARKDDFNNSYYLIGILNTYSSECGRIEKRYRTLETFEVRYEQVYFPVLRPLSGASEAEVKELGFETLDEMIDAVDTQKATYLQFTKLFAKHFDVFGLIEKGEAIAFNQLEK